MWLQAAGALVGAGLSYFGEKDAAKKRRLAKEKAVDQIEENMYSSGEQRTALDNIRDAYDTNIASETNNAAFGLSGVLNSNSARALMTSKLLGQRASSELQAKQQMTDYNKRMGLEIAGLEAGTDTSIDTGNVLMGGFAGANIGDSLDKMTTTIPKADTGITAQASTTPSSQLTPLLPSKITMPKFAEPLSAVSEPFNPWLDTTNFENGINKKNKLTKFPWQQSSFKWSK